MIHILEVYSFQEAVTNLKEILLFVLQKMFHLRSDLFKSFICLFPPPIYLEGMRSSLTTTYSTLYLCSNVPIYSVSVKGLMRRDLITLYYLVVSRKIMFLMC